MDSPKSFLRFGPIWPKFLIDWFLIKKKRVRILLEKRDKVKKLNSCSRVTVSRPFLKSNLFFEIVNICRDIFARFQSKFCSVECPKSDPFSLK